MTSTRSVSNPSSLPTEPEAQTLRRWTSPLVDEPPEHSWWTLTSDEALLAQSLPDHRPEYC